MFHPSSPPSLQLTCRMYAGVMIAAQNNDCVFKHTEICEWGTEKKNGEIYYTIETTIYNPNLLLINKVCVCVCVYI